LTEAQAAENTRVVDALFTEFGNKRYEHDTQPVRDTMARFLNAGMYPTKNGQIDVDGLYLQSARYLNLVPNEHAEQLAKNKLDAIQHRADHAARARAAGVSIGTRAPTQAPPTASNKRVPGDESARRRQHILDAFQEHSGRL
jgi:hypothetical protein